MARAFDKAAIAREIERERRARVQTRLLQVRAEIRSARTRRAAELVEIRGQCKRARTKLRDVCAARRATARTKGERTIAENRSALARESLEEATLRRQISGRERKPRSSAKERREESDTMTRNDIPEELRPVWERVKRGIKGNVRKSRAEAFLEWVEGNSDEVARMMADQDDLAVAKLISEQEALERELYGRRRAVPF